MARRAQLRFPRGRISPSLPALVTERRDRHLVWGLSWLAYAVYYTGRKGLSVVKRTLHDRLGVSEAALGAIEDLEPLIDAARSHGALVVCSADPLSLGIVEAPGVLGVDVGVWEYDRGHLLDRWQVRGPDASGDALVGQVPALWPSDLD